MQIVGECRDAAAARKLISEEGDPLKVAHRVVSQRPLSAAHMSNERKVELE